VRCEAVHCQLANKIAATEVERRVLFQVHIEAYCDLRIYRHGEQGDFAVSELPRNAFEQ
jgi:hypothetical protein